MLSVHHDDDPPFLLHEVARCIAAQEPVPSSMVDWFCTAVAAKEIVAKRAKGRPRKVPWKVEREATRALDELTSKGSTVAAAAEQVSKDFSIELSTSQAQKWLELARLIREIDQENILWDMHQVAMKGFRIRRLRGVTGEQALEEVSAIADWPIFPYLDELRLVQYEEEFGAVDAALHFRNIK